MSKNEADRVLFDRDGPVAVITLNRPEKLNALDPGMLRRLDAVAAEIDGSDVRVAVLRGAGDRAFCVGADVNVWSSLEPVEMWRTWVREGHRVFRRLAELRQPLIAVLDGLVLGGGLELALAADLRIASDRTELAAPEVRIGTVPGWAGTRRLWEAIGAARAKQMILTGERVDAATAERWGLVNEVVTADALERRVAVLTRTISENAPLSVQMAKQLVDGSRSSAETALESLAGALAATTEDGREGIASFRERRPPNFSGS